MDAEDLAAAISGNGSDAGHPYYPLGAAVPGYVVNSLPAPSLVTTFAVGCGVILASSSALVRKSRPGIPRGELAAALWFVLCGFIHFFFEGLFSRCTLRPAMPHTAAGYFAYNFDRTGSRTDLFGQLWKEYALSDSRYMTQDAFVVCMETITAVFWGPLSFVCAYTIAMDHPLRYPLQCIISLGQLYGDVLYYGTNIFDGAVSGLVFCRPEAVYFWAYYVLLNAFWIVIPLFLIIQSVGRIVVLLSRLEELERMQGKKHI